MLAFNEELLDATTGVNEDAPRREWTHNGVQRIGALGRKLLLFAADKARLQSSSCVAFCMMF